MLTTTPMKKMRSFPADLLYLSCKHGRLEITMRFSDALQFDKHQIIISSRLANRCANPPRCRCVGCCTIQVCGNPAPAIPLPTRPRNAGAAARVTGQGDVMSPLFWNANVDILLTPLQRDDINLNYGKEKASLDMTDGCIVCSARYSAGQTCTLTLRVTLHLF